MSVSWIDRHGTWLSRVREKSCRQWGESLFFGAAFADAVSKTGKNLDQRRALARERSHAQDAEHPSMASTHPLMQVLVWLRHHPKRRQAGEEVSGSLACFLESQKPNQWRGARVRRRRRGALKACRR